MPKAALPLASLPLVGHARPAEGRPASDNRDADRARWLAERYGPALRGDPRLARLRDALLAHGGWEVVPAAGDPQLDGLLSGAAAVWEGGGAKRIRGGEPNRCHGNAALAFLRRWPTLILGSGYALSEDGVWRQHSWALEHRDGIPTRVVETTVGRVLYAGFALDPLGTPTPGGGFLPGGVETMRFCLANIDRVEAGQDPRAAVEETIARDPRFLGVVRAILGDRAPVPAPVP